MKKNKKDQKCAPFFKATMAYSRQTIKLVNMKKNKKDQRTNANYFK